MAKRRGCLMVTIAVIIGILLPLTIAALLTILAYYYLRRKAQVRRSSEAIARSRAGVGIPLGEYSRLWADVIAGAGLLKRLEGGQNALIFGAKAAGRQAVMTRAVDLVNRQFDTTQHAAVYVDVNEVASMSTTYTRISIQALYRSLILAPVVWYQSVIQDIGAKPDRRSIKIAVRLEDQFASPCSTFDLLTIRQLFHAWLDRLGIQMLSLFLDDFSSLPADVAPVLLHMVANAFPRGSRVSLKLGATKKDLRLTRTTERDRVGLQMDHDIIVGLDIGRILESPSSNPSMSDPRQAFLLTCLDRLSPDLASRVHFQSKLHWDALFEPGDAWFELFTASGCDVDIIGVALEDLLPELVRLPERRVNVEMIHHAVGRAQAKVSLSNQPSKE
jgi:hypothetical protein